MWRGGGQLKSVQSVECGVQSAEQRTRNPEPGDRKGQAAGVHPHPCPLPCLRQASIEGEGRDGPPSPRLWRGRQDRPPATAPWQGEPAVARPRAVAVPGWHTLVLPVAVPPVSAFLCDLPGRATAPAVARCVSAVNCRAVCRCLSPVCVFLCVLCVLCVEGCVVCRLPAVVPILRDEGGFASPPVSAFLCDLCVSAVNCRAVCLLPLPFPSLRFSLRSLRSLR